MNKQRIKILAAQMPRTQAELEKLMHETVTKQLELEGHVASRDKAVLDAAQPFAAAIQTLETEITTAVELMEMWSEMNRPAFADARSIKLAGGHVIGWRWGQWKTALKSKSVTWASVVKGLQAIVAGCLRSNASEKAEQRAAIAEELLRTKEPEPNKEAMVLKREDADTKAILEELGVVITRDETFFFEPAREGQEPATLKAA